MKNPFKFKNETNSSLIVTCVAAGKCSMRHTTLCDGCENNVGMQIKHNYFKPKQKNI